MPLTTYIVPFHQTAIWFNIVVKRIFMETGLDPNLMDLGIARRMLEYAYHDLLIETALWRTGDISFRPRFEDWLDSVGIYDDWVREHVPGLHMKVIRQVVRNINIGIPEETWDVWSIHPYNLDLKLVNLGDYRILQWESQNKDWKPTCISAEEIAISLIPASHLFSTSANINQFMIDDSVSKDCGMKDTI